MVYYNKQARNDLLSIFEGLFYWKKHPLEYEHAAQYISDLEAICRELDQASYHALARYASHKKFGKSVYKYARNKSTSWYIIYDVEMESNTIYIQHITSNHTTKLK